MLTFNGNRTIRRQTNSRSVRSRTGQLTDWIACRLDSLPTGQLTEMYDSKFGKNIAPNVIFTNSLSVSCPVHELSSMWVYQSATWLTVSCFVGELSCKHFNIYVTLYDIMHLVWPYLTHVRVICHISLWVGSHVHSLLLDDWVLMGTTFQFVTLAYIVSLI